MNSQSSVVFKRFNAFYTTDHHFWTLIVKKTHRLVNLEDVSSLLL